MDELEIRRRLYAEPDNISPEMQQAIDEDPSKQSFVNDLNKFEQDLAQALAIKVPEGLADKLILRQSFDSHKQQKRKSRVQLALAASVVFAIGVTMSMFQFSATQHNLSDHALSHVYHEESHFHDMPSANLSLASLNKKMATFGANFTANIGEVITANFCRHEGVRSLHIVLKGEHSQITVLVMPDKENLPVESHFADNKFNGNVTQYRQNNVIVIAEKSEALAQWQGVVNQNIQWST